MQNWDRNRQDVKFKQKLNNIRSTLPKISYSNNASSSLITKKQLTEKNTPNLNNLENLYINATNKMRQGSSPGKQTTPSQQSGSANSQKYQGQILPKAKNTEMKRQNYLKHLLNEFGLSQYLRKLYELGYDDNNVNKIGLMSRKKFQELVINLKMYPGQSVKMEKLYDYLKQLNLANTMYNTRLLGGKINQMKNKKYYTSENNKRRIKTASGNKNANYNNNNVVNNLYNNYTNYGNNYLNNVNMNINNNNERPKTSTNFKVKPIQKTPSTNYYSSNNNNKNKTKTLDNNINNYAILTPSYYLNNKNQSNCTENKKYNNNNNPLLNSFKKGDLGYGFYMQNNVNNNNIIEDAKNQKVINYFNEELISQKETQEFNKFENINKFNNNTNNYNDEGDLIEEKMTEDIDNMLKYYMIQLNQKLDDSYGTVEDSSLSYNISLPLNELNNKNSNQNINNNNNSNNGKIKLSSIKDKNKKEIKEEELKNKEDIMIQNIKKAEINDNKKSDNNNNNNKEDLKKETEIKNDLNENNNEEIKELTKENKETTNINNINEAKILSDSNNNLTNNKNINSKAEIKKSDSFIEEINLDDLDKENNNYIIPEKKNENQISENINTNNIKENTDINNNKEISESKEKIKDDIDENIEIIEEKKDDDNQEIKYGFNGEKTNNSSEQPTSPQNQTQQKDNERYSLEENIYDNLRLTKSLGEEYLHQNMDKFDIEYMCRCLSLAIMKLLESSKGKQHITDLMEKDNEKFEFFNNCMNSNFNIITDFFGKKNNSEINTQNNNENNNNTENKISNLDKLELQENKSINDNKDINFLKHIKKDIDEKLIQEQEIKNRQYKLKNNLVDIEKDIKFIDEFFSIGRKRSKNYKGLTEKTKNIMSKELSYINEVDSEINNTKTNSIISNERHNLSKQSNENEKDTIKKEDEKKIQDDNYDNEFIDIDIEKNIDNNDGKDEKKEEKKDDNNDNKNKDNEENKNNINNNDINADINNKFSSISNPDNKESTNQMIIPNDDINTNLNIDEVLKINNEQIKEELPPLNDGNNTNNKNINKEIFESGSMESDYIIDVNTMDRFKSYLLKQAEVFDDDFIYSAMHIPTRKYVPPPDPQVVFEFCANIMILTKMEKEVIIITLLYLERFIFNTGLLLTSRNWRRIIFTTMAIASKIWDDDSFENNHFAQVFKHLSIGEINLLERTFLEMINYKVYVKCSEYFKYFFIIKSIALKYNYNGVEMIPISVERMMKIQEYAYQMQKRVKKKISLSNSTKF